MKVSRSTLVAIGVALLPIYSWSSGGLQLSHIVLLAYCGLFFAASGVRFGSTDIVLLMLVGLVFVREAVAVASNAPIDALMPSAYVLYSLIIFNALSRAYVGAALDVAFKRGLLLAAAISVSGVLLIGYSPIFNVYGERAVGTFNNPNQLGYFAVCLFSIASLMRLSRQMGGWLYVLLVGCALFLAAASLSKAAMLSLGLASVFAAFALIRDRRILVFGLFGVALLIVLLYALYLRGAFSDFAFVARLEGLGGQRDDSFEARGYIPWYSEGAMALVFGLGFYGALAQVPGNHEVHSTVASFFVQYGLAGGLLFVTVLLRWVVRAKRSFGITGVALLCGPALFYGIAHNGSRFTVFWVLIAVTFGLEARLRNSKLTGVNFQRVSGG